MSARHHSPHPFHRRASPNGHIIVDAFGDSVGVLAASTGDHDAAEQLANAELFAVAPDLLVAATFLLQFKPDTRKLGIEQAAAWQALAAAVARSDGQE